MADIEDRLRATLAQQSEVFEASDDLADRIDARVRTRRRQRRVRRGGLTVAALTAVVAVAALVVPGRDDGDSLRTTDRETPHVTTPDATAGPSTTQATTTTSSTPPRSSGSAPAPQQPSGTSGSSTIFTPTRRGIDPIEAGMTLRQAEEVAGVTIPPPPGGGGCIEAYVQGNETFQLLVEPAADPMAGVIRAVTGSVLPSEEGAQVGQTRAELLAALGQPTGTEPDPTGMGGEILVFEAGGYAYGALVVDDMVYGLQSGDPAWVASPDGCP